MRQYDNEKNCLKKNYVYHIEIVRCKKSLLNQETKTERIKWKIKGRRK